MSIPAIIIPSPGSTLPVSVAEALLYSRVDDDSGSLTALFTSLITLATDYCQVATRRQFISETFKLTCDHWPLRSSYDCGETKDWFYLPRAPLSSVTNVKYYDTAGVQQTLSASAYQVDTGSEPGRIAPAYGYTWPSVLTQKFGAVEINYVGGYGALASSVPEGLKTAIKQLVTHLYDHPEIIVMGSIAGPIPWHIDAILSRFTVAFEQY